MKYNELAAFIAGWILIITGAILYAVSESTPNGDLGRKLEIAAYFTFIPGVLCMLSMFVLGNRPKS